MRANHVVLLGTGLALAGMAGWGLHAWTGAASGEPVGEKAAEEPEDGRGDDLREEEGDDGEAVAVEPPKASEARPRSSGGIDRPVLETRQGRYFRFSVPKGWTENETTNGVDLTSPDGKTGISSFLLMGAFGNATPRDFLAQRLQALGLPDARIETVRPLPDVPLGPGLPVWKVIEAEVTLTYQGVPSRATVVCGVIQGAGQYCATVSAYQAPAGSWEKVRTWLPVVARSVVITNPREVAGLDRVQLPRNNPLDDSAIKSVWKEKGVSGDRMSQASREGTMGYERMASPTTGRKYELPLERHDPAAGGYRNPDRPEEILVRPPPGE